MIILIIILILTIVGLTVALAKAISRPYRSSLDDALEAKYRNGDGYHLHYDKSIIEKKEFQRHFPDKTLRSFSHLFMKEMKDDLNCKANCLNR